MTTEYNADDFLATFGLGPRKCEDCGETFTVPPYLECATWKHCTPCSARRFDAWIKTPEAKVDLEAFEKRLDLARREERPTKRTS